MYASATSSGAPGRAANPSCRSFSTTSLTPALALERPTIVMSVSGRTHASAWTCPHACGPEPNTRSRDASGAARELAATAESAGGGRGGGAGDRGERGGGQGGERGAVQQHSGGKSSRVDKEVEGLNPWHPPRWVVGGNGGDFDADTLGCCSRHEQQFAAGDGHDGASCRRHRVESRRDRLRQRGDRSSESDRCEDSVGIEPGQRLCHRSTNPVSSSSCGSSRKTWVPVACARPVTSGIIAPDGPSVPRPDGPSVPRPDGPPTPRPGGLVGVPGAAEVAVFSGVLGAAAVNRAVNRVPMIESWVSSSPGWSVPSAARSATRAPVPDPHGERSTSPSAKTVTFR